MAVCHQIATTDVFRIEVAAPGKGQPAWDTEVVDLICMRGDQKWPHCWDFRSSDCMGEFDAVLVVREVRFYAHRAILCSVSHVFRGMFTTENRDKYELEHQVAAEDATPEEFEAFLHCVYPCGKEPSEEFLVPVAILADYYGIKPVLSSCIALIVDSTAIPKFGKLRVASKTNSAELEDRVISTLTKDDIRQLLQSDVKEHLGEKRLMKVLEKCASLP